MSSHDPVACRALTTVRGGAGAEAATRCHVICPWVLSSRGGRSVARYLIILDANFHVKGKLYNDASDALLLVNSSATGIKELLSGEQNCENHSYVSTINRKKDNNARCSDCTSCVAISP